MCDSADGVRLWPADMPAGSHAKAAGVGAAAAGGILCWWWASKLLG